MFARRRVLAGLAGGVLAAPAFAARDATLTLVVGARRGAPTDHWARGFVPFIERHWPHVRVSIANVLGDGGLRAAQDVVAAPPEACRVVLTATPNLLARAVERHRPEVPAALTWLASIAQEPVVFVARPGTDLAALRRLGPAALLATSAPGGAAFLAAAALDERVPLTPLAFPSGPAARQAVLAGHAAAGMLPLPHALGALREGRLAALAIGLPARSSLVPETPTFAEARLPPAPTTRRGLAAGGWAAEAGRVQRMLRAVAADPDFAALADESGFLPGYLDGAAWMREAAGTQAALQRLWSEDPWPPRQD